MVQSSLRGVLPRNAVTASSIPAKPPGQQLSRRSLPKNSPLASSASVTPSVTTTSRSPGFNCRFIALNFTPGISPTGRLPSSSLVTVSPEIRSGGTCPQLISSSCPSGNKRAMTSVAYFCPPIFSNRNRFTAAIISGSAESSDRCEYSMPCNVEATTAAETPFPDTSATTRDSPFLVHTGKGLSLVVADVSGKGVSAAVVASTLQGMLYSHLSEDSALPEMIAAVNRFLFEKIGGQKYATLVIARLFPDGQLELINCGHVPPLLISGDTVTRLEDGNLPVGLIPGVKFNAIHLQLKPGGRLVVVTDGVTEAEDATGEFFGSDRLDRCCPQGFGEIE